MNVLFTTASCSQRMLARGSSARVTDMIADFVERLMCQWRTIEEISNEAGLNLATAFVQFCSFQRIFFDKTSCRVRVV